MTYAGGVVTVQMAGHGFVTAQTVSVFGAIEPEYNGNQIITVSTPDTFSFPITGTPTSPATGTIQIGGERTAGTITNLTRSGSTVTAVQAGHGFVTGNRARIVGANEPQYNGVQTLTVIDANTYTYQLPASATPNSPATGTITARYGSCGLGWSIPYTATNQCVLKQGAKAGVAQAVLAVVETDASNHTYGAGFMMAEGATGVSTFTNPFYLTPNYQYTGMLKSNTADATARGWVVVGDHRTVIICTKPQRTSSPNLDGWMVSYFGDYVSYLPADQYPQVCIPSIRSGSYTMSATSFITSTTSISYNAWIYANYAMINATQDTYYPPRVRRNHLEQTGYIQIVFFSGSFLNSDYSVSKTTYFIGDRNSTYSYDPYPDPVHGGVRIEKMYMKHAMVADNTGAPVTRGELRGIWNPGHRRTVVAAWANNDVIVGAGEASGKTFEVFDLNSSMAAWMLIETSDTWSA
jgi:hypothetical protein